MKRQSQAKHNSLRGGENGVDNASKPAPAAPPAPLQWLDAVERIRPYVVKISTPQGHGTGFLFVYAGDPNLCGIATAWHVIREAHTWEDPIRIEHIASGKSKVVRVGERSVSFDQALDTAALVVEKGDMPFPADVLPLTPTGRWVKVGVELGWVGFPALAPDDLCFFSGPVSAWLPGQRAYLVDGTAIHGVSGGPAFLLAGPNMMVVGVVAAYHPHRLPGETWPGLSVVRDVKQFQTFIETLRSIEEAKRQEAQKQEAAAAEAQAVVPGEDAQPDAAGGAEEAPR